MGMDAKAYLRRVRSVFRKAAAKKLLTKYWREKNVSSGVDSTGFCYIATETLFHLVGGVQSGYRPVYYSDGVESHWWLQHADGSVLDPTADQYGSLPIPYHLGKRAGFQNGYSRPSKRAAALLALLG